MKLTRREVTLLFLLAVVALAYFGINYLIMPQYRSNLEKQQIVAQLNDQLTNLNIDGQVDLDALMKEAKAKSAEVGKSFSFSIDPEQIDYWVDTLLTQNALSKVSSAYTDMTPSNPDFTEDIALPQSSGEPGMALQNAANIINGVNAASPSAGDASSPTDTQGAVSSVTAENGNNSAADANVAEAQQPAAGLYCTQLVLNAAGSYDNISKFMDALYASGRSLVVDGFTISDNLIGTEGKLAVITVRFFGAPMLDEGGVQAYDFPAPQGRPALMTEPPAPTPTPSPTPSAS